MIIYKKLTNLTIGKSPGPDTMHPRVLKEVAPTFFKALKLIFDMSLKNEVIPEEWENSLVSAIHKKGSKLLVSNYRPISLTCIACKVLESLIRDHIMSYFLSNKLFSAKQFGFITCRSTMLQLLNLIDQWTKYLEDGGQIDVIYTDFEKAFDKVPHRRLLSKLSTYGINGVIINWIKCFLCNRRQRVRINGIFSDWTAVSSGIPQGTVLGPILFVIYINDLPQVCDNLFLFADDAKLYRHIQDINGSQCLQKFCQQIYDWSEQWLMRLNTDKCKLLTIARKKDVIDCKYGFNTKDSGFVVLERVQNMKDLGVTFDSDFSFKDHIYETIKKAYQVIGIIGRNFKALDIESFILLYKSLARSHLEYANSVWNQYKNI